MHTHGRGELREKYNWRWLPAGGQPQAPPAPNTESCVARDYTVEDRCLGALHTGQMDVVVDVVGLVRNVLIDVALAEGCTHRRTRIAAAGW